jgi:hypothetical protein
MKTIIMALLVLSTLLVVGCGVNTLPSPSTQPTHPGQPNQPSQPAQTQIAKPLPIGIWRVTTSQGLSSDIEVRTVRNSKQQYIRCAVFRYWFYKDVAGEKLVGSAGYIAQELWGIGLPHVPESEILIQSHQFYQGNFFGQTRYPSLRHRTIESLGGSFGENNTISGEFVVHNIRYNELKSYDPKAKKQQTIRFEGHYLKHPPRDERLEQFRHRCYDGNGIDPFPY